MFNNKIGIDLGSDNLRIYIQKTNKFINSKSLIVIDNNKKEVIEYGLDACKYIEKEPENIIITRPIKKGKIEDVGLVIDMLRYILKKHNLNKKITNPTILVSYDKNITEVEKNALIEAIKELGCKSLYLLDSTILNCLGIGVELDKNISNMLIDIGYEVTRISVIYSNEIVEYKSIELGGNTFNEELINYIRKKDKTLIGYSTVENMKKKLNNKELEVSGRNIITGLHNNVAIKKEDLKKCLNKLVENIVIEIKKIFENISPEILNDICEKGIIITGGGSMLNGLREKFEEILNIPILITKNPETNVIMGIKYVLDNDIKRAIKI